MRDRTSIPTAVVLSDGQVMAGAAAAGGLIGFCLIGPIVGVVGAAGAAYTAANNKGAAGAAIRSVGAGTVNAAAGASRLNRDHKLTERAAKLAKAGATRAQELSREWGLAEKIQATARRASEFEQEHQLTARAAKGLSNGLAAATRAIRRLPPGWLLRTDPATGREFYVNEHTGESQWELPDGPAPTHAQDE